MITEEQARELHALYVRLTGLDVALNLFRIAAWQEWSRNIGDCIRRAEQPGLTLRIALQEIIAHRQRKYSAKPHTLAAVLRFGNLVERPDYAEEDLAESLRERRARKAAQCERSPRASVLRATLRKDDTTSARDGDTPNTQAAPEVVARLLADLKLSTLKS
jgi:hypothetical protein